ncbi:MAG: MFS transporter [Bacteroidota bacterium]
MTESQADTAPSPYSRGYTRYVLLLLTGVYTFNFIDRQILVILQDPIKAELGLSDTQLGLLTGFAFAVLYVVLGIPVARWADTGSRKKIIAISLAVWSAMTALSGLAQSYVQLLLARIGVGIGEAGGSPPSHALISDYYPPEKRASALAVYSMGIYIGIFVGFVVGGIIAEAYGWRTAFYAVGIPGLIYALLVYFTVREVPKGQMDAQALEAENKASFAEVLQILFSKKTFMFLALATGLHTFGLYGVGNFYAPFLSRVFEMDTRAVGINMGLAIGFGGIIGTFAGGYFADRLRKIDLRWYLWISIIVNLLNIPVAYFLFYAQSPQVALVSLFISNLFTTVYMGPSLAVTHSLVPANMRALASAVLFFVLNFIGLGLGPLTIGILSDYFEPQYGVDSLRYAFSFTFITWVLSILCFYLASRFYLKEYRY